LLAIPSRAGLVRKLLEDDALADAISRRLIDGWPSAVCQDFRRLSLFMVTQSRRPQQAAQCVEALLGPRPGSLLGPEGVLSPEDRQSATSVAQDAATWWQTGDVESLALHWSAHAPQRRLSRGSDEIQSRADYRDISTPAVRLFGARRFAVAVVEMRARAHFQERPWFVASRQVVGSPVAVLLAREKEDWKILGVGILSYDLYVANLEELIAFPYSARPQPAPSVGKIVAPADGSALAAGEHSVQWQSPQNEGPVLRLLARSYDIDQGWPGLHLTVLPSDADHGSVAAPVQSKTEARLWTVAADGQLAISDASAWPLQPKAPAAAR
jgi:hypothetical protein